jgi:hypothetical protein
VDDTLKSKLKSLPADETHGKRHPIRRLNASSVGYGARETTARVTSRAPRCGSVASK